MRIMTHALTKFRQENNLTLDALGERIGATKGMVSKWEAGKAFPRRRFIAKIAEVTAGKVSANDFLRAEPIAEAAE